jgi:hypothetical protein
MNIGVSVKDNLIKDILISCFIKMFYLGCFYVA